MAVRWLRWCPGTLMMVALCGAALLECAPDRGSGPKSANAVDSVWVTPYAATLAAIGDTIRFVAHPLNAAGREVPGVALTWTTGDSTVATVSQTGLATAVKQGDAMVTATASGGVAGQALVQVRLPAFVDSVSLAPRSAVLRLVGDTVRFVATEYTRTDTLHGPFTWSSSDSTVTRVGATGLVTAMSVGSASITARGVGAAGTALVAVLADFVVLPDHISLSGVGSSAPLQAVAAGTLQPVAGQVAWASLNPAVAGVDGSGRVRGVAAGQAAIAATVGGVTAYALVTVSVPEAVPVTRWTQAQRGQSPGQRMLAVWGASASDVYVAGDGGLWHFNGTAWSQEPSAGSPSWLCGAHHHPTSTRCA